MFKKVSNLMNSVKVRFINQYCKMKAREISAHEVLCNERGSGLVEYVGIALVVLVIIVVVVLPAMKNLFQVDIFPGLTSKVNSILSFT